MKYVIGIDFGTLSVRAVVADAQGRVLGEAAAEYPHGVLREALPDGTPLIGKGWALQAPQDYPAALAKAVVQALECAAVDAKEVCALAVDSTGSTVVATDENNLPLCLRPEFAAYPHAYVKLWMHLHSAPYGALLAQAAKARGEGFLRRVGGTVSDRSLLPRTMETMLEAPEVYEKCTRFWELSDYVTALLTGEWNIRSGSLAMLRALWDRQSGNPSREFCQAVHPGLHELMQTKLGKTVKYAGDVAGGLCPAWAQKLSLPAGIPVGMSHSDGVVGAYGTGLCRDGDVLITLGTSSTFNALSRRSIFPEGFSAVLEDSLYPGVTLLNAGQRACGSALEWFVGFACTPGESEDPYQSLAALASALPPGGRGVMALDWWDGNRSILHDSDLAGLLIGLKLTTRAEDIYRALLESIAFGQRMIWDSAARGGFAARHVTAVGGLARKNPLLMQILCDVLNVPITLSSARQGPALGSAVCAAYAAGLYPTLAEAASHMAAPALRVFEPDPGSVPRYEALYRQYTAVHDFFGRERPDIMHDLGADGGVQSQKCDTNSKH